MTPAKKPTMPPKDARVALTVKISQRDYERLSLFPAGGQCLAARWGFTAYLPRCG